MDLIIRRRVRCHYVYRRGRMRYLRHTLRTTLNPFVDASDVEFLKLFRFSKPICRFLIDKIAPHLIQGVLPNSLTAEVKVLCALRFLATGSFQRPVGQDFYISLSQTSVSRCLREVCDVVNRVLGGYIQFPTTHTRVNEIKQKFYAMQGIPGVIGLIDGTHISIKKPRLDVEHVYYSVRKNCHTKNVQIVCDGEYRILSVNARFGGSAHDSFVFNNSMTKLHLKRSYENGNLNNSWLLGDSGYGLLPYLLTPYTNPVDGFKQRYNTAHKKTRRLVENCIGILKSRFRCLSRHRTLMYSPQRAGAIINTCCILHNILIDQNYPFPNHEEILDEIDNDNLDNMNEGAIDNVTLHQHGIVARDRLAEQNFQF